MYWLNVAKFINGEAGFFIELNLPVGLKDSNIIQFEIISANLIFALYSVKPHGSITTSQGYILVYNGLAWAEIPTPVKETIYSIAADWSNDSNVLNKVEKKLFFSTDDAVYQGVQTSKLSTDGDVLEEAKRNDPNSLFPPFQTTFHWEKSKTNLPARAHLNHLRTGWDGDQLFLYVSSYGRSVYRAVIREKRKLPGLLQSQH